jgi:hypothetical protein
VLVLPLLLVLLVVQVVVIAFFLEEQVGPQALLLLHQGLEVEVQGLAVTALRQQPLLLVQVGHHLLHQ